MSSHGDQNWPLNIFIRSQLLPRQTDWEVDGYLVIYMESNYFPSRLIIPRRRGLADIRVLA